ncbi:MAG TPA: protealysin inhibitor emfourin [Nocardioides sp.]|nr:protealysin inhibitor emfourin [Nocardioides sp.]
MSRVAVCQFVPAYLLERLAATDLDAAPCGRRTREIDERLRGARAGLARASVAPPDDAAAAAWEVYDAGNGAELPGKLARGAGDPETGDPAVDEAAAGLAAGLALLSDLGRSSYDDRGASVVACVHYERDYDNAFWDGSRLVFGDGDGRVFGRFTKPVDVLAHELGHAVTQYAANLTYADQPGALNESVSDVIGACVKQRVLGQDAAAADWLIGEGLFLPGVNARALRSMKEPGTAYDDPAIGSDPQVGSMSDYVETAEDNGGVHINSGIPNRAFYLAASSIGGVTWEGPGRIWYAALTSGMGPETDFRGFADATVAAAGEHADAVREAWEQVGVLAAAAVDPAVPATAAPALTSVGDAKESAGWPLTVRRSGGFAGQVREATVDLDADDDVATRARHLFEQVDTEELGQGRPVPDAFVYSFRCGPVDAQLGEHDLTPELRELADLVLRETDR